jgi:hypothetical protein
MSEGGASRESVNPRKAGKHVSLMLRSRRFPGLRVFISVNERIVLHGKFISWAVRSQLRTTLTRPGNALVMGPACS